MSGAICHLCGEEVPADELVEHLRRRHPEIESDPATWPDGRIVVVDRTLEPEDFR